MTFAPFAIGQALVFLEFKSPWHSQLAELVFIILGVSVGIYGLVSLPISKRIKAILVIPYALIMTAAVWFSMLPAVCGYFGDCL
ncbi:hypothetical protein CSW60_01120 [Caulobacter sp. X]|nr:hypothetical protein CSW60_01120 [Caulobacter sp. X]